MEAGDPPVHRQGPGPLAAPWGEADAVFAARPGVLFSPNPTANLAGVTERIKVSIGMLRRISVVLISALLMMGFTTSVAWADQPPNKGQAGSDEIKSTGKPTNPNGFGTVTSQLATADDEDPGIGTHTSAFAPGQDPDAVPAQRLGVGNISRNDGGGRQPNTTRPGDHADVIDGGADLLPTTNALGHPGKQK